MVDHAAVLLDLRSRIAEKPSHGRQELLVLLAELEQQHRVPEDEMDRALRLVLPQALDLLFNRGPLLADVLLARASSGGDASGSEVAATADPRGDAATAHHSIAA